MWNLVFGGLIVVALAGVSTVHAQQQSGGERGGYFNAAQLDRPDSRDVGDTLASLKERLRLTPEQERNWSAFETAHNVVTGYMRERMQARQERDLSSDPADRMRQRAESLSGMGAALARLADTEGPLYNSLNDDQKRQFSELSPRLLARMDIRRRQNDLDTQRDGCGCAGGYGSYRQAWRHRDEDDRTGWRDSDGARDGRRWRDRDAYDRPRWNGRYRDERGGWRDRDDYDDRGWHGRHTDAYLGGREDDRARWHDREEARDGRDWRDREDHDRSGWNGRYRDDRRGWRQDDRARWRDREDYDDRGWRGRYGEDRRRGRDRDDW
jgi:hypothetical protein